MKNFVMQLITDVVQSPKVAHTVGGATVGTSLAALIELIPADVGKVGVLFGILLSSLLVWVNYRKSKQDTERHKLAVEQDHRDRLEHEIRMSLLKTQTELQIPPSIDLPKSNGSATHI